MENENGGNEREDRAPAYQEGEDDQSAHESKTGSSLPDRSNAEKAEKNGEEEQIHKRMSPRSLATKTPPIFVEKDRNEREDRTPVCPEDEDNQSAHTIRTGTVFPDRSEAEEAEKNGEGEQIKKSGSLRMLAEQLKIKKTRMKPPNNSRSDDYNRSHVPQFGNWENQDNVPYTVFFDKARKGRTGGQMVNPNDPEDNRSVLSDNPDSVGAPPVSRRRNDPTSPVRQGTVQSSHERVRSRKEVGMRQYPDPSPNHDNMGHRTSREANVRSNSSEQSVDRSPLYRQAKARDSPSLEGNRSYDSSERAPTKTRIKPPSNNRSHDNFDRAAAVPKFGGWNNDPTSAEGYTAIVNKVREERCGWNAACPTSAEEYLTTDSTIVERPKKLDDNPKVCCFWYSK